ncbi:CvpA family protein [Candidatus Roizmanbacteria bacterium]|nr:CvpA family protein [Candidatus Roizmanbacteria bacterium]
MIESVLQKYSLHGNWVDLFFILLFIYFTATSDGFIDTLFDAFGFIFSLIFSYKFYPFFGALLIANFSLPKGLSYASGFFISWILVETILYLVISFISEKYLKSLKDNRFNIFFGFAASIIQTCVMFLFFVSLVFALPVKGQIKEAILQSRSGPFFVNLSQRFEKDIKNIFGGALSETLNFITIKPGSNETVNLGVKVSKSKLSDDAQSEKIMFDLVNEERKKQGVATLQFNDQLRYVARKYAEEMFENGFFSHTSQVDGSSPSDRSEWVGISFLVIGENLAYAPDVYLAHQGLMNSEGHRKNILSSDYGKVGIGVIDGGIYGKMFVQEFTN